MSGLLDIWKEWRDGTYAPKGYNWGSQETDVNIASSTGNNSIFKKRTDLSTAGGTSEPKVNQKSIRVDNQGNIYQGDTFIGKGNRYSKRVDSKGNVSTIKGGNIGIGNEKSLFKQDDGSIYKGGKLHSQGNTKSINTSAAKTQNTYVGDGPWKMRSGSDSKFHENGGEQEKWWNTLANKIGFDYDRAKATWKDKGGFEGLMANPAFTMGLAFLQAGAEGKNIGQGALDNVVKAGGISQHYKKIIEDRKQAPIEVTAADVSDVKDLLATMKVEEPNMFEKAWGFITKGDTGQAAYDQASEQIASAVQKEIESMQRNHKGKEPFVIDIELKKKVIRKVLKSGKIKYKKSLTPWTSGTVKSTSENPFGGYMAEGGPVEAGKAYVVGEKGPEVIIPTSDGEVLSNDDSQIYAMLLASNPQLQKVSRARAEKILRARFPEYFE